jgi:prophage regulatory protein
MTCSERGVVSFVQTCAHGSPHPIEFLKRRFTVVSAGPDAWSRIRYGGGAAAWRSLARSRRDRSRLNPMSREGALAERRRATWPGGKAAPTTTTFGAPRAPRLPKSLALSAMPILHVSSDSSQRFLRRSLRPDGDPASGLNHERAVEYAVALFNDLRRQVPFDVLATRLQLEAAAAGDGKEVTMRFLRPRQVLEMIGVSRTTLWRMVQAGNFPRPVCITQRNRGYLLESVEAWMKARTEGRPFEQAAATTTASDAARRAVTRLAQRQAG